MRGNPYKELRHLCPFESNSIFPNNFHLFIFCTPYTVPLQYRVYVRVGVVYLYAGVLKWGATHKKSCPICVPWITVIFFRILFTCLLSVHHTIYGTSTVQGITELRHLCPLIAVFFPNNFHVFILSTPFSVPLWYRVYVRVGVVIPVCGSPQMRGSP